MIGMSPTGKIAVAGLERHVLRKNLWAATDSAMWGKPVAHNTPWEQGCSLPTHPQWASWAAGPGVLAQAAWPPAAYSQCVARALCCGWVGYARDRMGCALPALFGLGCGGPTLLPAWPWRAASRGSSPLFFLFHADELTEPTMTEIGHVPHYFLSKSFSLLPNLVIVAEQKFTIIKVRYRPSKERCEKSGNYQVNCIITLKLE